MNYNNEEDRRFKNWKVSYKVKRCPNCKYFIEKNDGCNHITCSFCGYQFCWLCLQKYKPGHYDSMGKCFELQNSKCICLSNSICRFLYKLLFFLLRNIGFDILGPIAIFLKIFDKIYRKFSININKLSNIISYFSVILLCLSLSGLFMKITSSISIIMIIIWPLQKIIFEKVFH